MIETASPYRPPWWLRSPHVQSLLGSSPMRVRRGARMLAALGTRAEAVVLDAGEGVRLQGVFNPPPAGEPRGLALLLHGWEGSSESSYMRLTAARLLAAGFATFRLNFRDHGGTHHLNPGLFHSNRIDEVVRAAVAVAERYPIRPLVAAGYSLGGNFALRIALRAPAAGIALGYALAVCPIIDPAVGLYGLETGPWFYQRYFLHKWRRSLLRKQHCFPDEHYFEPRDLAGDLRGLTRALVLRHTDFGSLDNYLDGYSIAGDRLAGLAVPATILTAADDPVIPVRNFRTLRLPPTVELDITAHGGHCGFISDWRLHTFAAGYIAQRMARHLDGAGGVDGGGCGIMGVS